MKLCCLPLALLVACVPDPRPPGSGDAAPGDAPHTDVHHLNRGPAGDGKPDPNAPVPPPPGVDPPPAVGAPPGAEVPAEGGVRIPTGYTLVTEPDPGWSKLPASERVMLRGTVYTLDRGQVRLSAKTTEGWKILDFSPVVGGVFEVAVPKGFKTPLYVSVNSDALGDGPTDDDPLGALVQPVQVGDQDLSLEITIAGPPEWLKALPIDGRSLLTRGSVDP